MWWLKALWRILRMHAIIWEGVTIFGVSIGVFLFTPITPTGYLLLASAFAFTVCLLMFYTFGITHNPESAPTPVWILGTIALSLGLGMFWPATPIIVLAKLLYSRRRRREQAKRRVDQRIDITDPVIRTYRDN